MMRRWGIGLVALVGCGGPSASRESLRIPLINDPVLNPVLAQDVGSIMINKVIFPGLVRPDSLLHVEPDLAESWQVSPDGRVYTFHLRPRVRWHDGLPFTAKDVKFTFDQIIDPNSGTFLWSDFSAIQHVDVVDELTVRFTLTAPFAPFLALLGNNAGIVPEHLLKGKAPREAVDFNRFHPVGTGPFKVVEVVPGSSITLVADSNFYGARPKFKNLVFKIVPDLSAQVAQLRAGELDFLTLEPSNLSGVEHVAGITIRQVPVVQHYYVGFNQRRALFQSPLVRQAFGHAIDRDAIIKGVLKGNGDYPQGTIPVVLREFYADTLPVIHQDTAKALDLLRRAGWTRAADGMLRNAAGLPFRFTLLVDKGNPSREQTALAIQQDLKRIGMDVSLQTLEFATVVRDFVQTGKYDANLIWWNTPPDPDQYSYYATGQPNNTMAYSNRQADSLLSAGRLTTDSAARVNIYRAWQVLQLADPPVLVLYYPREIQVFTSTLRGLPALGIRDALRHAESLFLAPP